MKEEKPNIIWRAYENLDNFLLYSAEKAVHAWNWTTGKTKADLANLFCDMKAITFSIGAISSGPLAGILVTPIVLYAIHRNQLGQRDIEKLEVEALNSSALNHEVVKYKSDCKAASAIGLSFFSCLELLSFINPKEAEKYHLFGAGMLFNSASCYVMRTDYLPPRKSVVKRAKEKLTEMLQEYREKQKSKKPIPQPIPYLIRED
ncbi:hypothetical protein HYW76_01505 [Candidatus Pacearchaeota archaeon]|nr:hypothetical protein [Candidatus Pacearchaeota archaeon]